jgi:hypothetical protein
VPSPKKRLPAAQCDRRNHQHQPVEQPAFEQLGVERRDPLNDDGRPVPRPQLRERVEVGKAVAGLPSRRHDRPGQHVFLRLGELCRDRIVTGHEWPVGRKDVVRSPSEQQVEVAREQRIDLMADSKTGSIQPPCAKPPVVSSSDAPGARTTPSSDMNAPRMILRGMSFSSQWLGLFRGPVAKRGAVVTPINAMLRRRRC